MCDFRSFPTGVKLNGEIFPIHEEKRCHKTTYMDYFECSHIDDVTDPGVYFIIGTGSGYDYYDGRSWRNDAELLFREEKYTILCDSWIVSSGNWKGNSITDLKFKRDNV